MNLGEKINELRKKKQLTQEMLAERLCVSPQAVSKWERGVANPDLYLIPKLAEVFNISSDVLLGISSEEKPANKKSPLEQRVAYLEKLVEILLTGDEKEAMAISLRDAVPVLRFDFTRMTAEEKQRWHVRNGEMLAGGKGFFFHSLPCERPTGNKYWDPQLVNEAFQLPIDEITLIRVRLKTIAGEKKAKLKLLFITEDHTHWHEGKRFVHHYETGKTVTVDFSTSHPSWYGKLIGLRIDTTNQRASRCEIEAIEFLDAQEAVRYQYTFTEKDGGDTSDWKLLNSEKLPCDTALAFVPLHIQKTVTVHDPILALDDLCTELGKTRYVHVRLRTDYDDQNLSHGWTINDRYYNAYLHIYFKTNASDNYSGQKRVRVDYVAGGGAVDVYADMSKNGFWNGTLTGLRLDSIEGNRGGRFDVECIEIFDHVINMSSVGMMEGMRKQIADLENRLDDVEAIADECQCYTDDYQCTVGELQSNIEELKNDLEELRSDMEG